MARVKRTEGGCCGWTRRLLVLNGITGAAWLIWLGMLIEALTDETAAEDRNDAGLWRSLYGTCLGLCMVGVGLGGTLYSNVYLLGAVSVYGNVMFLYCAIFADVDYSLPAGTNYILAVFWALVTYGHYAAFTALRP